MFIAKPASKSSTVKRKLLYSVGINDADYITYYKENNKIITCPFYMRWTNMLKRCYSAKHQEKQPTYIGCSVCAEWLLFSNFKSWMITKDWKDKELDKDLLVLNNKIYSPNTCVFVSKEINNLLLDNAKMRGSCPQGVSFDRSRNKYRSQISINGRNVGLGRFNTVDQAVNAYKIAKYLRINDVASNQDEPLRSALLSYRI